MNLRRMGFAMLLGSALALWTAGCGDDHESDDHEGHDHGSHEEGMHGSGDGASEAAIPYPLDTCLVSGEELGAMGDPFVMVYEGQEIKLCCRGCKKDFEADPERYLSMLRRGGSGESGDAHEGHDHEGHDHE